MASGCGAFVHLDAQDDQCDGPGKGSQPRDAGAAGRLARETDVRDVHRPAIGGALRTNARRATTFSGPDAIVHSVVREGSFEPQDPVSRIERLVTL